MILLNIHKLNCLFFCTEICMFVFLFFVLDMLGFYDPTHVFFLYFCASYKNEVGTVVWNSSTARPLGQKISGLGQDIDPALE